MLKFPVSLVFLVLGCFFLLAAVARPDQVRVRYTEGITRGFMVVRTLDGEVIAEGENSQNVINGVVTIHLTFKFKDGSVYDDTTTFTQRRVFRLLTDHLVQKGPSFSVQTETWIDTRSGRVKADWNKDGKQQHEEKTLDLPADLSNGLLFTIIKNLLSAHSATVSYLAFAPEPKVVKMVFSQEGKESMLTGGAQHEALRFLMKVDIGGISGAVATVLGKKPADTEWWVILGDAPTYAGSEGPLYDEGPVWKINLVSPVRSTERHKP